MKLTTLRNFLCFFVWAVANWLLAQEPAYLHYDVSDGLPSTLVYCGLQDSKGILWFGTLNGLARFDGTKFNVFGMKHGLPDQEVLSLFEDSQGRLWVSCFAKRPTYMQDGKFVRAETDSILSQLKLAGSSIVSEDSKHNIWITVLDDNFYKLTPKSIKKYSSKNVILRIGEFGGKTFALGTWYIYKLIENGANEIHFTIPPPFLPVTGEVMDKLKKGLKEGIIINHSFVSKPRPIAVEQSGNRVLYSFTAGLLLVEYDGNRFKEIGRLLENNFSKIYVDKIGRFWVVKTNGGIVCFDHARHGLNSSKYYLEGIAVSNVFEDREKNLWFTTRNNGIYMLPQNATITYKKSLKSPFMSDNITALCRMSDGRIVCGDDNGSIYTYKQGKFIRNKLKHSVSGIVRQITPLSNNRWLAVLEDEVIVEGRSDMNIHRSIGSYKSAIEKDSSIWIATSNCLMKKEYNNPNVSIVLTGRTMLLQTDEENNVWVCTPEGFFSEKDEFKKPWGKHHSSLSGRIVDMKKASGGALWAASPDYGLLRIKVKAGAVTGVDVINEKLVSPIENINSIYEATDKKVWLATNKGIFSVSQNHLVEHYSRTNGLANNDVSSVVVEGDTLWAATASGLSRLLLKGDEELSDFVTKISGASYSSQMGRKEFDLLMENDKQKALTIPAGATMLQIDMTALYYRTQGNLRFELITSEKPLPIHLLTWYNLFNWFSNLFSQEIETSLVEGTSKNFGTNLTPSRYCITTTAILPSGTRSICPDQITVTVLPHWWQTIWVTLALLAATGFGLWRLWRAREDYLKVQNINSELQLQAIRSQMNPHFVGNSINAIQQFFYPPDPIKASEYISIFSDLLRRTMYFSETDFISFEDELGYVKDYLEMIKLRFGDRFSYEIKGTGELPDNTPFPAMFLQPILENATIHGLAPQGGSFLCIEFGRYGERFLCTVTDNGVGIEATKAHKLQKPGGKRVAKGIVMLEKKIQTLNHLYPTEMKLEIIDLATKQEGMHGTQVTVSFLPPKNFVPKGASEV